LDVVRAEHTVWVQLVRVRLAPEAQAFSGAVVRTQSDRAADIGGTKGEGAGM